MLLDGEGFLILWKAGPGETDLPITNLAFLMVEIAFHWHSTFVFRKTIDPLHHQRFESGPSLGVPGPRSSMDLVRLELLRRQEARETLRSQHAEAEYLVEWQRRQRPPQRIVTAKRIENHWRAELKAAVADVHGPRSNVKHANRPK